MNRRAVDSGGRPGVDEKFSSRRIGAASLLAVAVAALIALTTSAPGTPVSAIEAPDDVVVTVSLPPPPDDPDSPDTPITTAPLVTRPPISANDFIPDDQDLTTCIGVLERPGCGSESRGGWHQRYVLIALLFGMIVVFGNVIRGVRKRDSAAPPPTSPSP